MQSQSIKIINKLGLHARASMALINTASQFSSDIRISYQNRWVDAKDILQVMALGASCGATIEIKAMGDDEDAALQAVIKLIQSRFGESE